MTKYILRTYYDCSPHAHAVIYDSREEAEAEGVKRAANPSVTRIEIGPVPERHPGLMAIPGSPAVLSDDLGVPRGFHNALHILAAVIFSGWFCVELIGRVL